MNLAIEGLRQSTTEITKLLSLWRQDMSGHNGATS